MYADGTPLRSTSVTLRYLHIELEIMDDDEAEPTPASVPAAGDVTDELPKDPAQEIPAVADSHSEHRTETKAPSQPKPSSSQ